MMILKLFRGKEAKDTISRLSSISKLEMAQKLNFKTSND
jgi:hypothetical protein